MERTQRDVTRALALRTDSVVFGDSDGDDGDGDVDDAALPRRELSVRE
jgi:hypothetical protein